MRRRCGFQAYGHRAIVSRCPCGRCYGGDRRRPARVHRQSRFGNTAVLSARALRRLAALGSRLIALNVERDRREAIMSQTIWIGAVAYDPKVVSIWEGMRRYFHEEARLPVEVVLLQFSEAQAPPLLGLPGEPLPRIQPAC